MKFSIHDLTFDQVKKIQALFDDVFDDVFAYTTPQCPTSKCPTSKCDDDMVMSSTVVLEYPEPQVTKPARKPKAKKVAEPVLDDEAMLKLLMDLSDE